MDTNALSSSVARVLSLLQLCLPMIATQGQNERATAKGQKAKGHLSKSRWIFAASLALLFAACTSSSPINITENPLPTATEPQATSVVTEEIGQPVIVLLPTPARPSFEAGTESPYSQEQMDLIQKGAFAQQEVWLRDWLTNYWGLPQAQNRPFLPEAVDLCYIYFFDQNDPDQALVALQPGGEHGDRIYYLPVNNGQFMRVPPEAPAGEFDIPTGFAPLEISGGDWELGMVGGQWVRLDEEGRVRQRINMETAQWETSIEVGNWAEKEDGTFNTELMFPLVGAINYQHHGYADLIYGSNLKVAVSTGENNTQKSPEDYDNSKKLLFEQVNKNSELKAQLDQIKNQDLVINYQDDIYVVVEGGIVKWVVNQNFDIPIYYSWENGQLNRLDSEQEPHLLPDLRLNWPYTERIDTNEKIQFIGFGTASFTRQQNESILDFYKRVISRGEKNDIVPNAVVMQFSSSEVYSSLEDIEKTARFLEAKGIYLVLNPINELSPEEDWFAFPTEKTSIALEKLASRLAHKNNIIWNLFNEVGILPDGWGTPDWNDWAPWISKLYNSITNPYKNLGKSYPIILVGGIGWSRDFRDYIIPLPDNTWSANVHNYKARDCDGCPWYDITYQWQMMIDKTGVWITEDGALLPFEGDEEDLEHVRKTLKIVAENPYKVHYLMWNAGNDGGDGLFTSSGILPKGRTFRDSSVWKIATNFTD